jgi:hypothetical protein
MSDPAFIFPQVIDATMRSAWRACPHQFFRRHVQGLVPPGEVSVHLHFGGCLAKGLEVARRTFVSGSKEYPPGNPDRALFNGCEAIIAAWGNYAGPAAPNVNEKKKSLDACILSLAEYFKTWPLESDDVTIHAWLRQLQDDVALMLDQWDCFIKGDNYVNGALGHPFPQAFDNACHDFNHPCAFVDLCSSEHPDRWLDNFAVRRWDPLTRTED